MYIRTYGDEVINMNCVMFMSDDEGDGIYATGSAKVEILGRDWIADMFDGIGKESDKIRLAAIDVLQTLIYEGLIKKLSEGTERICHIRDIVIGVARRLLEEKPMLILDRDTRIVEGEERLILMGYAERIIARYREVDDRMAALKKGMDAP